METSLVAETASAKGAKSNADAGAVAKASIAETSITKPRASKGVKTESTKACANIDI